MKNAVKQTILFFALLHVCVISSISQYSQSKLSITFYGGKATADVIRSCVEVICREYKISITTYVGSHYESKIDAEMALNRRLRSQERGFYTISDPAKYSFDIDWDTAKYEIISYDYASDSEILKLRKERDEEFDRIEEEDDQISEKLKSIEEARKKKKANQKMMNDASRILKMIITKKPH